MSTKEFYSRKEAAQILGVKENTIYVWERQSKIVPSIYIGAKPKYTPEDLSRVVRKNREANGK
jgi:predicted site-specific integrase-resolvase